MSKCDTCKMKRVCDELERMGKVPKHEKCRCYTPTKPITNANRIRSMTDEELAFYIVNHPMWTDESACVNWLKEEAVSDG